MQVGELCNREVVVTTKESSIVDVAKLMRKYHVGDVVVIDDHGGKSTPIGIATDRDIVIELIAEEIALNSVTIGEIMSFDLLTLQEDLDLLTALNRMSSKGVRRAPVTNPNNALVGIITVDDILEVVGEQLNNTIKLIKSEAARENRKRP